MKFLNKKGPLKIFIVLENKKQELKSKLSGNADFHENIFSEKF